MNHCSLEIARNEVGVSKYFPITHLIDPTIFETKNGMLGSVIRVYGVPFATENKAVLNNYKHIWHRVLLGLSEDFGLYVTIHRHKNAIELSGEFTNDFSREIDAQYHARFKNNVMYINDIYLTIIHKGIGGVKGINFLQRINSRLLKESRTQFRNSQIKALQKMRSQILTSLAIFGVRLLGEEDQQLEFSELLSFLALIVNAGESFKFKFPRLVLPITRKVMRQNDSFYPYGNIGQYICAKRLFFGEYIQFQSADNKFKFAAIIAIKKYAAMTSAIMFDNLLQADAEFIVTNSFIFADKQFALTYMKRHITKLENVNDPAFSQLNELKLARDMLASDKIAMGYHHNNLLLFADQKSKLEDGITKIIKNYADAGFIATKENIGQEPAFWAQIPGNIAFITRSAMITSENFVDFCPLHNYKTGFCDGNHLGHAVTLLETPAQTSYYFNYHVKSGKNGIAKGHTTIIGGNGCGKTVLMGFLDAQANRYGGRSFFFDRDRGLEIYIRASGGYYAILAPNYPQNSCFNPLQLQDTPDNRKFCRNWLAQLIKNENEQELPSEILAWVNKCIDYAFEQLSLDHRTLTNISKMLPINFPRWLHLRRWLRGDGKHAAGEYAYIFDNDKDLLAMHTKMGFDMTHFLDHEPAQIRTAILMYLFYRIELSLTGKLVSIYLDEGWQYFADCYWVSKLKKLLPTLRKRNAHIIIATQSPSSVIESELKNTVLDNCATNIYFPNSQADDEQYIKGFKLTNAEFEFVKKNEANCRLFLVKQEHESAICKLDLSYMQDILAVLSANTKTIKLLDKLRNEFGDNPDAWLKIFYQQYKLCK